MFGKVINIRAECYVSPSSFRFFSIGKISEKTSITLSGDLSKMRCCVSYLKLCFQCLKMLVLNYLHDFDKV